MSIHQIVYISSATELLTKEDLLAILDKSRHKNALRGVTGMLLYKDGNIMQVLEGPPEVVKELFVRISADPRHRGVLTLLQRDVSEREFPDWSMAFRDLADRNLQKQEGYNELLNLSLKRDSFAHDSSRTLKLISSFAASMR